ncbi:multicopper oxidase family protein [Lentibacillus salicampi]|uniref:Laccase n=1 Tax=Lentibacillus salicampi TaxID=175306 RepID=A0A4Y9AFE1_9BACI|nr:multicopper oxidase [Lentibacillus salicampi]TFJ94145.1 multicopper oxidase family protein [Lentibacillus salicampi]
MLNKKLKKFVDALPIPKTLKPVLTDNHAGYYNVQMTEFRHKMHRDLRPTRLWGYNGQFPGPVIDVNRGEPIQVKWENKLPDKHILPIDKSFHHLDELPEVRTVTHLHGSETKPESDGYPEAWYTRDFQKTGPEFKNEVYHYPNRQRGATLWYHDHAMGITRLNVYAGLAGMYIIREEQEKYMHLPSEDYEIPLIIMDRSFKDSGELFYPPQPDEPQENWPNPSIRPFFNGETNIVNGKIWPYLEVEPRKYRFRILNAANSRAYQLYLDSGQSFYQIGADGGLMQKTVKLDNLSVEPAERFDVIIDFSGYKGKTITLKNDLGPDAEPDDETGDVLQFNVNIPLSSEDRSRIPRNLTRIPPLKQNNIQRIRNLKLVGSTDDLGRPLLLLNNQKWIDPVTETPELGSTEVWSFINVTNFTHPMHIHLIQFQVLDRQSFDLDRYNKDGSIIFTGPQESPKANEKGWKDTVAAPAGQITRVIAKFGPFTGDFVWHCHILEHEDYDMMRPMRVIDKDKRE